MKSDRPPFLGLLIRATLWAPLCILLSFVWVAIFGAAFLLPILGVLDIWLGDYLKGAGQVLLGLVAAYVAWFIHKKTQEDPPSMGL